MNIKKKQADELLYFGFYNNVTAPKTPGTVYWYKGEEWTVGGTNKGDLLIPNVILSDGLWLPNETDLLNFLDRSGCSVNYTYNGLWLNMKVYPHGGKEISLRTVTLCDGLYNAVLKILNSDF